MFSYKLCKISKNTFSQNTSRRLLLDVHELILLKIFVSQNQK